MLVSQPPAQLLLAFSRLASLPNTEPGAADAVRAVGAVRRGATAVRRGPAGFATCCGVCGLAACFGASTVMRGSALAAPVAACETAVPLRPHSIRVERIVTEQGATKLDDNLMTVCSQSGTEMPS